MATESEAPTAGPSSAKARVRLAALELFSARGFRSTSVRDVMNSCQLTPGALYAHYPSKESLLFDLIHEGYMRLDAVLRTAAEGVPDPPPRLARLVNALVLYQLNNLDLARVANVDFDALADDMREQLKAFRFHLNSYFNDTFAAGIAGGVFDPEHPRLTVLAMLTSANDLTQWFAESGPTSSVEIARWHAVMTLRLAMCFDGHAVDAAGLVAEALALP